MYGAQGGLELGRHLLLVEAGRCERQYLGHALSAAGYRVSAAADVEHAARLADALIFDAIILGPRMQTSATGRLMSSCRGGVLMSVLPEDGPSSERLPHGRRDRVRFLLNGLERALADRPLHRAAVPRIEMGRVTFDLVDPFLVRDGDRQFLSPMQAFVLRRLAFAGGCALPRAKLHPGFYGGRGVDVTIARLRKLIEEDTQKPRYIRSVHGRGYRLTPSKSAIFRSREAAAVCR